VQTPNIETQGILSPDGRWLAYTSNLTGRFEVHVQSFPDPTARVQASPSGGSSPRWRRDGKELFYLRPDGTLMSVRVRSSKPLEFEPPVALFQFFSVERGVAANTPPYDVTADGEQFIVAAVTRRAEPSINVLLNWPALLTQSAR